MLAGEARFTSSPGDGNVCDACRPSATFDWPPGRPLALGYFLLTVSLKVAVPVPALLVALRVTLEVPMMVGVPEIRPVAAFTISPDGKPLAPKLVGLLVAVI